MDRETKENMVGSLGEIFKNAQVGYLVDYRGLSVEEAMELRRKLREASAKMRVLKNNLAKIAVKDTPFESLTDDIVDTRAIVYSDDPVAPAKAITQFAKTNSKFSLVAGVLVKGSEGQKLDGPNVAALALLPSKDELLAMFLSVLQAPQVKLVRTLAEIPTSFVRTLNAIAESKGAS